MNNIEIKRGKIKRSVESIIDESAIDHQYNFEAQQLRKSFNISIRDLNTKIKDQERQIAKLSLLLSQKQQVVKQISDKQHRISLQLSQTVGENLDLKRNMNQLKKRLNHLQYKLQSIQSNRVAANLHVDYQIDEDESLDIQKTARRQAYSQINSIMAKKIRKFTQQMKVYPIPIEAQRCLEAFLEQIIYINPQELNPQPFQMIKNRQNGKISDRKPHLQEKIDTLIEWQKLEKSVQKLKNIRKSVTPEKGRKTNYQRRYQQRIKRQ